MHINSRQRRYLRSIAHHRPVSVAVGKDGATAAVCSAVDDALTRHELIKVKLPALPRPERLAIVSQLCAEVAAVDVQQLGRIATIYRPAPDPRIALPD